MCLLSYHYPHFQMLILWLREIKLITGRNLKSKSAVKASMQDISCPTRDQTHAPCIGNVASQPLNCQGSPLVVFLLYCIIFQC